MKDLNSRPTINIMGIDPGTSTLGLAIFEVDGAGKIVDIITECVDASKIKTKFYRNQNLEYRLSYINSVVKERLREYLPVVFAIEMPFINPRRIGSVIPLARLLGVLMNLALESNPYIYIYKKSPSEIKNAVKAKGNADKEQMLKAILNITEIAELIDLKSLTDHEIDAIAVNYGVLKSMRKLNMISIF